MRLLPVLALLVLTSSLQAAAAEPSETDHLEIKWLRDSAEYQLIARQTFQQAAVAVRRQAKKRKGSQPWAVVLDVDETTLDTSAFWLEVAAYDRPPDRGAWDAWCERRVAEPVPGVADFLSTVRRAGGRVAFVTNRGFPSRQATLDNLVVYRLWHEGDLLCTHAEERGTVTKAQRRAQLREGRGACSWDGEPVEILAYVGDSTHDLPEDGEDGAFEDNLGTRTFLLPNPMYGRWETEVTRDVP